MSDEASIRRMLRTSLTVEQIADKLGIKYNTLRSFILRNRLCDLRQRRLFATRQQSSGKPVFK